ncbi:MAG: HemK2/MTQ2 family protein methyltransferase, partial [Candidatus Helarchaeales archaeon]
MKNWEILVDLKELVYRQKRFLIPDDVYEPSDDSFMLVDNILVKDSDVVLDMGCGSGILGIFAAEKATRVVFADVSPAAIQCARNNFQLNGCSCSADFVVTDLFENIEGRFDLILFNPPYLPIPEKERREDELERAWNGGPNGRVVI